MYVLRNPHQIQENVTLTDEQLLVSYLTLKKFDEIS